MVSMNTLTTARRVQIVSALVEGNSIRATSRMTGAAKGTVLKLLADLGPACAAYHDEHARDLATLRVEADEIWSFCYAKAKNVPAKLEGKWGYGDVWTWTAIDADTKFMISWRVGGRDVSWATLFMKDVASRLANRVQLTTDQHAPYRQAVEAAFGSEVDYAMLQKLYGAVPESPSTRYSPAKCIGVTEKVIQGEPDVNRVSIAYVERSNLTLRMSSRRFTRLTNAFSKKIENLEHAVALHFVHYNYCRPHGSLRGLTPAQRLGLEDRRWSIERLVGLLEDREASN